MKILPIPIPLDYAEVLGVDRTHLTHVNRGRRQLSAVTALKLIEYADSDPRLQGLTIFMLRPEAGAYRKFFLKAWKKSSRRLMRKCQVASCPIIDSTLFK